MRQFDTGATRDVDTNKLDFEAFLSPLVLEGYAEFMHKNRFQKNGTMRDGDNWQKGIPLTAYMKSGWRHFFSWWKAHRSGLPLTAAQIEECFALMFNLSGYLHETLKARAYPPSDCKMGECKGSTLCAYHYALKDIDTPRDAWGDPIEPAPVVAPPPARECKCQYRALGVHLDSCIGGY